MITLIVMSYNNVHYLSRCLTFYKKIGFTGEIFIADSSEKKLQEQVENQVALFKNQMFSLRLFKYNSGLRFGPKAAAVMQNVVTPYAMLVGIDDFYSIETIKKGIAFLEVHKDYIFTMGYSFGFQFLNEKSEWFYTGDCYNPRSFDQSNPLERINALFKNGYIWIYYSLFRTSEMKLIFEKASFYVDDPWLKYGELMFTLLALLRGKGKFIEFPDSWREMNFSSAGFKHRLTWITHEDSLCYWEKMRFGVEECMRNWLFLDEHTSNQESTAIITVLKKTLIDLVLEEKRNTTDLVQKKSDNVFSKKIIKILVPSYVRKILRLCEGRIRFLIRDRRREKISKSYLLNNKNSFYGKEFELAKQLIESSAISAECFGLENFRMHRKL